MNHFSVDWYFPTMKQLAESTVFPALDEIIGIQEDFPWTFFSTAGMERSLGSSLC